MDWKRFFRSFFCVIVVCCLIFNMSPIRAEAVALEIVLVGVAAAIVVGTVLIGLGVAPKPGSTAFDRLVDDCVSHLSAGGVYVLNGTANVAKVVSGQKIQYAVDEGMIEEIRSWLFSSGALVTSTVVAGSDIAVSSILKDSSGAASSRTLATLIRDNPAKTLSLFESLGVYKKVFVYSLDESFLYGFYFDPNGILCSAAFVNALGVANASLFGVYSVMDLEQDYSQQIYEVHSYTRSITSYYPKDFPIFYDEYSLKSYPDFLVMDAQVIDWNSLPAIDGYHDLPSFPFLTKSSTDVSLGSTSSLRAMDDLYQGLYYIGSFAWADSTYSTVTSTYDVNLGYVGAEDDALSDAYPAWYSGAISIPGSSIGLDDDDDVKLYPYFPNFSLDDIQDVTQENVWAGEDVKSDVGTGEDVESVSGSLANTSTNSFIQSLIDALRSLFEWIVDEILSGIRALFVPSAGFVDAKVDALAERYSFLSSIALLGPSIRDFLGGLGSTPPVIYIDLGSSRGSWFLGGRVVFIDLSWYSDYKPTVDFLLSAFIYLAFCWRLFVKLPGIISGMPGDFLMDGAHLFGLSDSFSRKAEYEIQRQSVRTQIREGKK